MSVPPVVSLLITAYALQRGLSSLYDYESASPQLCPSPLFLPLSVFFSTPPLPLPSPVPHTHALTRGMPESVEVLISVVGVPRLLRAEPKPSLTQIRKYWRSLQYHEKEKHLKEDFLQPMDICQKCWRQGQSHFITREVWWEWKLFVDYFEECKASNWDFVFKSLKTLTEEDPPERNIYSKPHWKKKKTHIFIIAEK